MPADLLVILLAHNEATCIAGTVADVRALCPEAHIAVVDDGSSDGTAENARAAGAVVLRHAFNLGVAAGEATGLRYGRRCGFRFAVRMDGDGQHDPACVQEMVERLRAGADLVIGSRFAGLETFRSTFMRRFGNRIISSMIRTLSGVKVTDPTSGFRGFSERAIEYFSVTHPHDYPEPESVVMASRQGFRIHEVPARMRARRTGTSSLTPLKSGFYMAKVSFALMLERMRG